MVNSISLHIFTNSTRTAPSTEIIRRTYKSFCDTFEFMPASVWLDKNPNVLQSNRYMENLRKNFSPIYFCKSLSDGYARAVTQSNADYLFMLEHDWLFQNNIKHSLDEIIKIMDVHEIYHFRFNKRKTYNEGWEKNIKLIERNGTDLTWCETNVLSNNPHIINRELWIKKCLPRVQVKPGSKGIEENLSHCGLAGAIYGPLDYPATVKHQDGRRSRGISNP